MSYGTIKVNTITFTNNGVDQSVTVSGLVASTSGDLTVTGTISGSVVQGGTLVSGATVTGTAGQFTNLTGNAAGFTTVTGTTVTGTTANFVTVSGITVTGTTAQFTTVTGGTAGFTTITGTTVTGTTANFAAVSGTTVTGGVGSFTTLTGGVTTMTSGVFATGSESNPSISFTSDPNTGIYSPGGDQVAISTNGTARVYVDGSGNVGIGTTSPVSIFDVTVGASGTRRFLVNYDDSVITIKGSNGTSDPENLRLIADSLIFNTGTVGSGTERVRIDSSGNVGIGTTNPVSALNISVADGGNVTISNTNDGHVGGLAFGDTSSNTSGRVSYDHFNDAMRFDTAGNERVRIDSSGNVGIGSTAPLTTLECRGQFSISNAASSFWVLDRDDSDGRLKLLDSSTSTNERLAVDTSGRLLVGTSSDSGGALLQVNGNRIRIATAKTPASASDTGTAGEICWDADYIYVCTATNTWKRTAIATW